MKHTRKRAVKVATCLFVRGEVKTPIVVLHKTNNTKEDDALFEKVHIK